MIYQGLHIDFGYDKYCRQDTSWISPSCIDKLLCSESVSSRSEQRSSVEEDGASDRAGEPGLQGLDRPLSEQVLLLLLLLLLW
jgi:hypothetical protein